MDTQSPRPGGESSWLASKQVLRFGPFELDVHARELRKNGFKIRLAGQPLQVLILLLERHGEIVTRDELRQTLWSDGTFVEFDVALSSAVRKVREALGDSADKPRFIETLPRQGYRFIAALEQSPETATISEPRPRSRLLPMALAAAVVIAVIAVAFFAYHRPAPPAATTTTPIRSIAVLPFENLTGDASEEYFVAGTTEFLTTDLAELPALRVTSRTTAMSYKNTKKTLPEIGRELDVDAVVEGSVAKAGDDLRISVQLIQAPTDRHLWAHNYDGDKREALAIQTALSAAVADAIRHQNGSPPISRASSERKIDPDAYDAYLKGIFSAGRQSYEGHRDGVAYFERAIARQPDYAAAYARLAETQLQLLYGSPLPPRAIVPKAEAAARKAIQLDDNLAGAHRSLGNILIVYYWDWEGAERELKRAAQLDGGSSEVQRLRAEGLLASGKLQEAMKHAARATQRDPLSFDARLDAGSALRAAGQYDRALAETRKAVAMDPRRGRGHFQLAITLLLMGRTEEAIAEFKTANDLAPNARFEAYLAYVDAISGRKAEALGILDSLKARAKQQYISSFGFALIYDGLGDSTRSAQAFNQAYEDHAVELSQLVQYPRLRSVSDDSRYKALLQHRRP